MQEQEAKPALQRHTLAGSSAMRMLRRCLLASEGCILPLYNHDAVQAPAPSPLPLPAD